MSETTTTEELQTLPRWARVALTARCARRVQPLFAGDWADAPEGCAESVERAVALSERPTVSELGATDAANAASIAARIAHDAHLGGHSVARAVASAAAYASLSAGIAAIREDVREAQFAVREAARAGGEDAVGTALAREVRRDYEALVKAARDGSWDDSGPVPPEFFGKIWSGRKPKGWLVDPSG